MTTIAILRVPSIDGGVTYCAVAGGRQINGRTAGEALDAMVAQLPQDVSGTLVVVQNMRPDAFFSAGQQERLKELMNRWRLARDADENLSAAEQAELEALVDAELVAAAERTKAIAAVGP